MAGPGTTWTGPLISGPIWNPGDARGNANAGLCVLSQQVTLQATGVAAAVISNPIYLPPGATIFASHADTTVAWNGTTAPLTVGLTAGGTDFEPSTSVATVGRVQAPTLSAAQLTAGQNVGTGAQSIAIYPTITTTGTATTGTTIFTLLYIQTVQLGVGAA